MAERPIVVDASAAVAPLRDEPTAPEVSRILGAAAATSTRRLVPRVFWLEVVNVLARRYHYSSAELMQAVADLDELGFETVDQGRPELLLVMDLVERHGLTAYDATYLALAHTTDARLLTADRRLAEAAGRRAILLGGGGDAIAEEPVEYAEPSWVTWPSAAAYLEAARQRVYRWAEESGSRQ
jgi:predicted nucleic acid-binding protein